MIIRVLDIESTGLKPTNAVCEIATVDLVGPDPAKTPDGGTLWRRGEMWSSLVNPGRPIPPEASAVHHITDVDVKDAPALAAVMGNLTDGHPDLVYAAHHAAFDQQFVQVPGARWICTWKVAVTCWPDAPEHKNQTLRYWLGLKLADAALAQPHRALGDAYVTAAILARAFRDFIITPEDMIAISAGPVILTKFHFGQHAGVRLADKDAKGNWLVPTSYLDWIVKNITDNADVQHTAKCYLHDRREAERNRSPVKATPPGERSA